MDIVSIPLLSRYFTDHLIKMEILYDALNLVMAGAVTFEESVVHISGSRLRKHKDLAGKGPKTRSK